MSGRRGCLSRHRLVRQQPGVHRRAKACRRGGIDGRAAQSPQRHYGIVGRPMSGTVGLARTAFALAFATQLATAPALAEEMVVEPIDTPLPPQPAPLPPPSLSAKASPYWDDVTVEIRANFRSAGLEPVGLGAERCLAPCNKAFSRDQRYRITGNGLVPSKAFRFPEGPNQITLEVQASRTAAETTGLALGIGGVVSEMFAWGYMISHYRIDEPASNTTKTVFTYGSVGGLGLIVLGGILYLTAETRVRSAGAPLNFGRHVGTFRNASIP